MATITVHKRKKGTVYTAQIRIRREGKIVHTESATFDAKRLANAWVARRETELRVPGQLEAVRHKGVKIGQVLSWYCEDFDGEGDEGFGRTKLGAIRALENMDLAELDALRLTSQQLIGHVKERRQDGAGPATVANDIIWLRIACKAVRVSKGVPIDLQVIDDASFICRSEGLIDKAKTRKRRPTLEELNKICRHYDSADSRQQIPMLDVVLFALFSSRRQEEICRIQWDDLESDSRRVLVRKMKHPRKKVDTWVFLTPEAWKIIQRQSKKVKESRIFPYNSKSISASFTRACKVLGIKDLHFHDLRHEGVSWLFECGNDIPRVSSISGHRSWSSLERYTHLQEFGFNDKYSGWAWRPEIETIDEEEKAE